jgi:Tol biopolymer transport system component/protocatechuate 3,4-dioxygenase beta subunit
VNVTTAQNGQDLFQQARLKERGERNIDEAIKLYERIALEFKSNPSLAANALLRLGEIHEDLGKPKARDYYDRIIKQYPDQKETRTKAENRRKALDNAVSVSMPIRDRVIWQDPMFNAADAVVARDGAYLVFVDRSSTGGLVVRDFKKNLTWRLATASSGETSSPAISKDAKRIAYSTHNPALGRSELHVVDVESRKDYVLLDSRNHRFLPQDWTPRGKILTLFALNGGGYQIGMVDASGGSPEVLKTFLNAADPPNVALSPDGRFIAYDYPRGKDDTARDISILGNPGGNYESDLVRHAAHDHILGWMPDGKWLLFGSDRGGHPGIWAVETSDGRLGAIPPIQVPGSVGEIRALGVTQTGSLVYTPAGRTSEARILEGLQPELARLQLAALQQLQPKLSSNASIEGVVVKLNTNEPVPGADLELVRLEGTPNAPLSDGFSEAFAETFGAQPLLGPTTTGVTPPALSPEVQFFRSGEDGKFVFRNLKPGKYRLSAALADGAYNPAQYGQRDPNGPGLLLPVGESQAVRDIRIQMPLTGVITGRVLDSDAKPLAHVPVFASQVASNVGPSDDRQAVLTDEQGNYRLFWLPPGQYHVSARKEDADRASLPTFVSLPGRTNWVNITENPSVTRRMHPDGKVVEEVYRRVYYGDTVEVKGAKPIDLRSGGHVSGVDINAGIGRTPSHHIRGVLINAATGSPAGGVQVRAYGPSALIQTLSNTDGTFDISGVVPGTYWLHTYYIRNSTLSVTPGADSEKASETIAFKSIEVRDIDIENVRLVASHPMKSTGRVMIEGQLPRGAVADMSKIRVSLGRAYPGSPEAVPPGRSAGNGVVNQDGAFTLWTPAGLVGVAVTGIPPNTYVKSIRSGNRDILPPLLLIGIEDGALDPIEIVIGTDAGEISGMAMSGAVAFGNALVVLVPQSVESRLISTRSDADGKFRFPTVRPGTYKIFSLEYLDVDLGRNPDVMKAYEASGKIVFVSEGTRQEIQVPVLPRAK